MSAPHVEMPLAVASYDIDYGGVVSNIVYVRWLEDMRHAVLQGLYPFERQLRERQAPAVVETRIRYLRPVRLLDKPTGRMHIVGVAGVRLSFQAEILVDGAVVTSGEQTCVFVNLDTGRPMRVPKEVAEAFALGRG